MYHISLKEVFAVIGIIAGAILGVLALLKKLRVIPFCKATWQYTRRWFSMPNVLDAVHKEVYGSNGITIRQCIEDHGIAIGRLTRTVDVIKGRVDGNTKRSPDPMFISDLEGNNLLVSRAYCDLLGVGEWELLGKGWRSFVFPNELGDYDDDWQSAFDDGRNVVLDVTLQTKHGTCIPCRIDIGVHRADNGQIIERVGVIRTKEVA